MRERDDVPPRERPAPEHRVAPETEAGSPFLQGVRAALGILAGMLALEAVAFLGNALTGERQEGMFILLGMLIAGGGFAVLVLGGARLPRAARVPFWAVGLICLAIAFILLGVTCGVIAS
ncbi:hypothetical protein [Longimicrobium sp.]|uniref:hypothetical protein n=1 Tax=Longimicrobium sp. TaxID=2029185 RepID=UPI002C91ACF0|nr:hypothetical protein [Longimicrobium sp.]HSU15431.1 hypothetical protein [Longimicrobium sp.]